MTTRLGEAGFPDALANDVAEAVAFDRFYFSLHGPQPQPLLILGGGVYPRADIVDGYVVCITGDTQRNLRLSTHPARGRSDGVQMLKWTVVEPYVRWQLSLGDNPSGLAFDLTWTARAAAYQTRQYAVADERGASDHAHLFQPGRYEGELRIGGARIDVDGWLGERDRSRGHRRVSDRLGIHLWIQAQFDHEAIGVLFNTDRTGRTAFCDGAVMGHDGARRSIVELRHALTFTDSLHCSGGRVELVLDDGSSRGLTVTSRGRAIYLQGGGSGGWHGADHGSSCIEHERWDDDPDRTPRTLPISLVQTEASFTQPGASGTGIFEYAHTRSPAFSYAPTLPA